MPWVERLAIAETTRRLGSPRSYVFAAVFIAIAGGARIALGDWLKEMPFLVFVPAVVAAAYVGGLGPGLLAVALAALLAGSGLPPFKAFVTFSPTDVVGEGLFVVIAVGFCIVIQGFHTALARLGTARRGEREFTQILEQRVADRTRELLERTRELDTTNARLRAEIVERERAEAEKRQAQRLQAIGQLTGGIAHDFNNLLTVIAGNLELVQRRLRGRTPELELFLGSAVKGAERAALLTHRLLAFSRQQALAPAPVNLNAIVQGMSDLIERTLGEAIEIETVLAGGLWRTFCDPRELETALLNLVVNARDAMPEGGKLTIETANAHLDEEYARLHEEVRPGQYVMIAVADTGMGMDTETREHVFEPFFTTKDEGRGTGLGLSMVFGFVKQSGGHIKAYSEVGQGASFKLYFPRLTQDIPQPSPVAPVEAVSSASKGSTVLVVEDDGGVRALVVHSLQELGYTVHEAPDGAAALGMFEAGQHVDLLLTDIGLPKISGKKLADAARQLRPGVKVLFMTGYTRNAIVHGGRLDPDVALLPKPFSVSALTRKVVEVLEGKIDRPHQGGG